MAQGGFDELLRRFVAEVSGDARVPSYPGNSSLFTADRTKNDGPSFAQDERLSDRVKVLRR